MSRPLESSPLADVVRRVDATADGAPPPDTIPTGFPSVDRLLGGGVRKGDLIVLGGDVGSGKSALALAIALRTAEEGRTTAYFGGEMAVERVFERALAVEGRARIDDLRRGTLDDTTRAAVGAAAHRLQRSAPHVLALPAGGPDALADELRRTLDLELAIVDPLQALASGARTVAEEAAETARRLKRLAVELDVAILVTSALPNLSLERKDPRPALDDFGALGAIKQHADVILGIFREEMYDRDGAEGATELLALKNRNGPTGYVDLYFYKQWLRFEDMLDPDR